MTDDTKDYAGLAELVSAMDKARDELVEAGERYEQAKIAFDDSIRNYHKAKKAADK